MNDTRKQGWMLLACVGLLVGGGALALWLVGDTARLRAGVSGAALASQPDREPDTTDAGWARRETALASETRQTLVADPTSAARFPVGGAPESDLMDGDVPAWRTGRTARLCGRITAAGVNGVPARIEILAGTNRAEVFSCGPDGTFESGPLYPGLAVVRVTVASAPDCVREVQLHHRRTVQLCLDLGGHGSVSGRVCDESGEPIAEATLTLDGVEAWSDADGRFVVPRWFSGDPLLVVRKAGYASQRVKLRRGSAERPVEIRLERACRLEIRAPAVANGAGETLLYLLPAAGGLGTTAAGLQQRYPWSLVNPLHVQPGASVVLEDLPAGKVDVVPVHRFAREPRLRRFAWLDPERPATVPLEMESVPVLTGRVLRGGRPVTGAQVVLQAENPMRATVAALGSAFKSQPVELAPGGRQETVTDAAGRFRLAAWDGADRLNVTDPMSGVSHRVLLDRGQAELEVELD